MQQAAESLRRRLPAGPWALALLLVAIGGPAEAHAQLSPRVQVAFVADAAPTATLGLEYRVPLGSSALPDTTGPVEEDVANWMATFAVHGGVTFTDLDGDDVSLTGLAQAGLLRRLPWFVDRGGVVLVGVARPQALGPALRVEKSNVAGLQAGMVWGGDGDGVLVSVDLALSLICDLAGC